MKSVKKQLQVKRKRMDELSRLMQTAYEDRVNGKMPEDICLNFIQKYSEEQKTLATEITELEEKLNEAETARQSADEFIRGYKMTRSYLGSQRLFASHIGGSLPPLPSRASHKQSKDLPAQSSIRFAE